MKTVTDRMKELLRKAGSPNYDIAHAAQVQLAQALTTPLRQGVLKGDIVTDIYEYEKFEPGVSIEYPLDFLSPGSEKDFVAYTIPAVGKIPERHVEGDYVMVSTYETGSSIDFAAKYAETARWPVMERALEVLEASFIRKMNTDGWRVLLAAGVGRNLVVYDDMASTGLFTKRLVALMKTVMRRQAGGNSTSTNRGKLTRLYTSPEAIEDIRSWDLTQVDDITRREIFISDEASVIRLFNVELRDIDELGIGQEFQDYYENRLSGTYPGSKTELVVGLDLSKNDAFFHPVVKDVELYEDTKLHRQRRVGFYGWENSGWTCLSATRVLLGAL